MAGEITVPLLPCRDIDQIVEFYGMLGFTKTYYQQLPNPMVALKREDINLQFFGMPEEFKPEDSYGSCLVIVRDTGELYRAFAEGVRAARGKLLVAGIPRMTRPRKRKNAENHSGFTVVDPGGNWIRIMAAKAEPGATDAMPSKLAKSLQGAVVMGDSHGYDERAAQILDAAFERDKDIASATDLVEALAYRAELAFRLDDIAGAAGALTRARSVNLSEGDRDKLAETLANLEDLEAVVIQSTRAPGLEV